MSEISPSSEIGKVESVSETSEAKAKIKEVEAPALDESKENRPATPAAEVKPVFAQEVKAPEVSDLKETKPEMPKAEVKPLPAPKVEALDVRDLKEPDAIKPTQEVKPAPSQEIKAPDVSDLKEVKATKPAMEVKPAPAQEVTVPDFSDLKEPKAAKLDKEVKPLPAQEVKTPDVSDLKEPKATKPSEEVKPVPVPSTGVETPISVIKQVEQITNTMQEAAETRKFQKELTIEEFKDIVKRTVDGVNNITDLNSTGGQLNLYLRSGIGKLSEEICFASTGSIDLNKYIEQFPWADGATHDEIQQIKSHVNMSQEKAIPVYAKDLRMALGIDEKSKIAQAVESLGWLRSTDMWEEISKSLPPEVANAQDPIILKNSLLEKITLRIPFEDVEKVKDYVRRNALENPEQYGLGKPPNETIEKLLNRIQPIGLNIDNQQMRLMSKVIFQEKMKKEGFPIGVDPYFDVTHRPRKK